FSLKKLVPNMYGGHDLGMSFIMKAPKIILGIGLNRWAWPRAKDFACEDAFVPKRSIGNETSRQGAGPRDKDFVDEDAFILKKPTGMRLLA
ncbi:unnamed protein product, partial [Ilex paraguariensis]